MYQQSYHVHTYVSIKIRKRDYLERDKVSHILILFLYVFAPLPWSYKYFSSYEQADKHRYLIFLTLFILVKYIVLTQAKHKNEWLMLWRQFLIFRSKPGVEWTLVTKYLQKFSKNTSDQNANYWGLNPVRYWIASAST